MREDKGVDQLDFTKEGDFSRLMADAYLLDFSQIAIPIFGHEGRLKSKGDSKDFCGIDEF